ncbi:MAG: hypothetical protein QME48_06400 [bacterium]|uniref:Uncharacterized protein n=1 Tax=candidate division WOR-3 bacterium TaxID=2052148 RepID=A0A348MIU5_UNCW3|nr:hypothetical protein [bacterium]HAF06971.1 hypothetical protein [candidate division WOR-3 bacterium]HCP16885.1 hypothetical protein [candidate division WOR-3 bacterium]
MVIRNYLIILELLLFIFFNILIFVKTESIVKTFISLFQIFPPLLVLLLIKYNNTNDKNITIYTTIILFINFMIQISVIFLIKKIAEIKKTDRNYRPDEYDE